MPTKCLKTGNLFDIVTWIIIGLQEYCNPLVNEENFRFFSVFCDWLEPWNSISEIKLSKLKKETFTALHHTTNAFLKLTEYCIKELKMLYIYITWQISNLSP